MYFLLAVGLALLLLESTSGAAAVPADPVALEPGEYIWHPEIAPLGPVVTIVHLDEQRAYVYRNGIAIGVTSISSGRPGYETPAGVFTILERKREHYSNLYDNAPMPHMMRLTWSGLALHAGALPGYPASHGCIRLPPEFAEKLFTVSRRGDTVVVTKAASAGGHVHSGLLAPVTGAGDPDPLPPRVDGYVWDEQATAEGPVSVLVSLSDRQIIVLRNGIRIGRAALGIDGELSFEGSILFVVEQGLDELPSRLDPARPRHRWTAFPLTDTRLLSIETLAAHLHVPDGFARRLYGILVPGTTVLLTDRSVWGDREAGQLRTVLESGPAESE